MAQGSGGRHKRSITIRAQIYNQGEIADVVKAMDTMNEILGVDLSHTQFVVALARQFLKQNSEV